MSSVLDHTEAFLADPEPAALPMRGSAWHSGLRTAVLACSSAAHSGDDRMTSGNLNRREVLAWGAMGAVAAAIGIGRGAAAPLPLATPLALLDGTLSAAELAQARALLGSHEPRTLDGDLVWLWRTELRAVIAAGAPLLAITRWDKAVLFAGLAREAAFTAHQSRIAPAMFRTSIRA